MDRRPAELPHGLQSLTQLARVLAGRPKILVADEPAAGLNPMEVGMLQQALKSIQGQGVTILLVEHNMEIMSLCDRVIALNYGNKITEGLPEEVRCNEEVVQAYFGGECVT